MDCKDCAAAELKPVAYGKLTEACEGCHARDLARSPQMHRASSGYPAELQHLIRKRWPHSYNRGKVLVWAWVRRIEDAKNAAADLLVR